MSRLQDIDFEPPGYPIYRAFIIPYRRDRELYDVVEVDADEVDLWRRMLEILREFLSDAIKSLSESGRSLKDYEKLELLGDLISLFLRTPLNREVFPSVAPSPLKAYMLMRLTDFGELFKEWERINFDPLEFTYTFYNEQMRKYLREDKQLPTLSKMLSKLETTEVADLLESCWLLIPADTRPILNTSSLIPHLLLTSAIAWSMAINKGIKDRKTLALLRLAALFHDIGKPFKYENHVEASVEVARELLKGLILDEDVALIIKLIEEHHSKTRKSELSEIVSEADCSASAIDRLKRLLDDKNFIDIRNRLEEAAKALNYNSLEFDDWSFWQRIHEEYDKKLIRDLSERFVEKVRKLTKNFTVSLPKDDKTKEKKSKEESNKIKIVLIDVGGIQSFIYKSHSLKQVAAASLVIDSLVMAYIVAFLQWIISEDYWLPYEAFLHTAGGNVEVLVPYTILETVKHSISKLGRSLTLNSGIPLYIDDADLHEDYAKTVKELAAKMSIKKISINNMLIFNERYSASIPKSIEKGFRNVCQICFMEPPTTKIQTPEGEVNVCGVCSKLHEIGLNIHFKEKYDSQIEICGSVYRPREVFEMPWDGEGAQVRASEYIMEIIAGHDLRELQELGRLSKMRNISVIKVDGTLMGPLMATCLSIADAYERSARIDLALKKSIEVAINEIYNGVSKVFDKIDAARAALSIKMGILYAGGDDAVIFVPSWASPLIALILGKEFLHYLGCVRGLSIGIATASPKANIWALVDAASELMHKAKKEARKKIKEGLIESTICFDIVEAGDLSGSTISERFEALKHEKLTVQPFNTESFEGMLCKILGLSAPEYSEIARLSYLVSRNIEILRKYFSGSVKDNLVGQISEIQQVLKNIRHTISEVLQAAKSIITKAEKFKEYERYVFPIAYIYACRQIARVKMSNSYEFVKSLIPEDLDSFSSLSDVDRLIKIIGGGVI
ncbi:MAG: HD domain-containing protein [Crenarchaeota archaeon]|nr:HD domain-containing protein [Thermoproteota archaeon]